MQAIIVDQSYELVSLSGDRRSAGYVSGAHLALAESNTVWLDDEYFKLHLFRSNPWSHDGDYCC